MKVLAYKSPHTGQLFDITDYKLYMAHMRAVRAERREAKRLQQIADNFKDWLSEEKAKICYPEEIGPWFLKNQQHIMDAANALSYNEFYGKFKPGDEYLTLSIKVNYQKMISNTHHCPENGVKNFGGRNPDAPQGYPGWCGWVKGTYKSTRKRQIGMPWSTGLKLVGIQTGAGSGSDGSWGYELFLWADDWPMMKLTHEHNEIVKKLKGIK